MRQFLPTKINGQSRKLRRAFLRWRKDNSGTTAIEFGMIGLPFFMLIFGILGVGLHFFASSALQHSVEAASRTVRTGQAINQNLSVEEFRREICNRGVGIIDCSKLEVHLQSGDNWGDITPQACLDNSGTLVQSSGGGGSSSPSVGQFAGCSGTAYIITACYEFALAEAIPFLQMGTNPAKPGLMQASAAGRTEPHDLDCNQ